MNKIIGRRIDKIIRQLGLKRFVETAELNSKLLYGLSPIIIYQMGKVGSTTIYNSLRAAKIPNPVFHLHVLSDDGHQLSVLDYQRTRPDKPFYDHIRHSQIIRSKLTDKNIKWKIITLVRDPIAREISDYFQTLKRKSPESFDDNENLKDITSTIETLSENLINFDETTDVACTWFDRELKTVFGIDVYAYPFDRAKGYKTIDNPRAEVSILRLEDLNQCSNILTEFLGARTPIKIINKNIGSQKNMPHNIKKLNDKLLYLKLYVKKFMPQN